MGNVLRCFGLFEGLADGLGCEARRPSGPVRFVEPAIVEGRDGICIGNWRLLGRPLQWRLGVETVAIDPSATFRKALRMWLPRTAVSVDVFHLVSLANQAVTEAKPPLSQHIRGRRGRAVDPGWANRRLLLRAHDTLSDRGRARLRSVFDPDDPTGQVKAVWEPK